MIDGVRQQIAAVAEGWAKVDCTGCGDWFVRRASEDGDVCPRCIRERGERARLEAEVERIRANMTGYLARFVIKAGMTKRETSADAALIPAPVRRILADPRVHTTELAGGGVPVHGFGLCGHAGVGKTFALASLFMSASHRRVERALQTDGFKAFRPWFAWVRWPEQVNEMRVVAASREDGLLAADQMLRRLAAAEAVVIDDLGAERLRGSYDEDWSASQLDGLIDARYNNRRPTWYTTNLSPDDLLARYGTRLFSRLAGDNPMFTVAAGPDLRMVKGE